jgi:cytoskeletal protein CcmA (bactofilin family)
VHIEENAQVEADITAEEVVIAGEYTGKLTCRQRVEIRATGRVSGTIDTAKLLLHEGGYFDGELHMQKTTPSPAASTPSPAASTSRSDSDERPRRTRYVDIAGDNSSREVGSSDSSS